MPTPEPAPPRPAYSLHNRLAMALAVVLTFGGIGVAVAAIAYGRNAAQQSFDRLLIGAASQIAEAIYLRDGAVMVDLPVSAFELLALARDDRVIYAVVERGGAVITGYDGLAARPDETPFFNATFAGEPIRVAHVARHFSERGYSGTIDVLVGQTLGARGQLADQITRNSLIPAALAGFLMVSLSVFAVRSALRPLRRIERDIASRAIEDFTPMAVPVPDEVTGLVAALNRYMTRLDRQVTIMRNLIGDASHQLRTPIAALRAQAELAYEETDPEKLRLIATRIHRRSVNLSRLTDQLLSHAMIIHRADTVPLQRIDLRTVAITAMQETDHGLFGCTTRPRLDLPERAVTCDGDPLSLVEACKNLLGNALRHGAAPVTLAVTGDADTARLVVRDAGPGLPRSHWQDAGSRYARASGVSAESAGVGLSIVQAVATSHRGRLCFAHDGDHFEASVVLPRSAGGAQ